MRNRSRELRNYIMCLQKITNHAQSIGLPQNDIQKFFENSLISADRTRQLKKQKCRLKTILIIITTIAVLFLINWVWNDAPSNYLFCKIQEFIYPGLKLLRLVSIPIISAFPSLTELYDETCLVQNPYFQVSDMDCFPCASVHQINELCESDVISEPQINPPFIYNAHQKLVNITDIHKIYIENKKTFDNDASKINVDGMNVVKVSTFFQHYSSSSNYYRWRINRMLPALLVRTLFPRPNIIPRLGQSTERFILIDEPNSKSYSLPEPECNYVFVIQSTGERMIEMKPSKECNNKCDKMNVLLPESYMLWYNWWYWRPESHSTTFNSTSISYVGSYC